MMNKRILMIMFLGVLSGCISGTTPSDTYTGRDGKTTVIETDKEMCKRSCNQDYSRCMDSSPASDNEGINGPSGVFGASGECRNDLQKCLGPCKAD